MINQHMKRLFKEWGIPCSITGEMIPLSDLRYWNIERNEAYRDANVMLKRHTEVEKLKTNA